MPSITPAELDVAVREDFEVLDAELRKRPGVAEVLEILDRHELVLEQTRAYLLLDQIPPIYSTSDHS